MTWFGNHPPILSRTIDRAMSGFAVARTGKELGRSDAALEMYKRSEREFRELLGAGSKLTSTQRDRVVSGLVFGYMDLGTIHTNAGRAEDAIHAYNQARELLEATAPSPSRQYRLTFCYQNLAKNYASSGQLAKARPLVEKALALIEQLARERSWDFDILFTLAATHAARGEIAGLSGDSAQALASFQEARTIMEKVVGENPAVARFRGRIG